MTGQVTGQQSAPYGAYPTWVRTTGQRYRRGIDALIRDTLVELLAEDAASHLGPLAPHHVVASGVHGAELALDGRHGLPLRLRGPNGAGGLHTLYTRAERREWMDRWARHVARLYDRSVAYSAEIHRQFDALDYTVPVYGSDGQVLTGRAELDERYRLWGVYINDWYHDDYRGRNKAKRVDALRSTRFDPTPHALSADVATARGQCLDRLDDAAGETRRWLLDDEAGLGAGPATVGQEAELRRLEERRQAGRRSLRAATTVPALRAALTAAEGLVRGVGIEDAPVWRDTGGLGLTARRLAVTYAAPGTGRWSYAAVATGPYQSVASKTAAALGAVVLDDVSPPAGWTVASTPRAAPAAHERDVTVSWIGTGAPEAGIHEITLTARNACGPRNLVVAITVPAATPAEGNREGESS